MPEGHLLRVSGLAPGALATGTLAHDVAVIGGGPGGVAAALEARRLGASVVLIEREHVGGTCLNWGCIPTKAFLASAELLHAASGAAAMGIEIAGARPGWAAMKARREKIVERLRQAHLQELKHARVPLLQGTAHLVPLTGPPASPGTLVLTARAIILATGSRPGSLPGIEPDGQRVLNSGQVLQMPDLPRSLAVIGGGVIGCEFASLFADLGVDVTVIEALPGLLALTGLDDDVAKELGRVFRKRRVKMHFDSKVEALERGARDVTIRLSGGKTVTAERALLSIGRRLNTGGLGLEEAGLRPGARGEISVDENGETAVRGVYAIGDITGQAQLAHLAAHHGLRAVRHALGQSPPPLSAAAVPGVVFTRPPVAMVGLSEQAAKSQSIDVAVGQVALRALGKAHVAGELDGLIKVIAERPSGRMVGVHMVGARTDEMIGEAALAVRLGLTLGDLADTIHPHPTMSEGLWEAVRAALR